MLYLFIFILTKPKFHFTMVIYFLITFNVSPLIVVLGDNFDQASFRTQYGGGSQLHEEGVWISLIVHWNQRFIHCSPDAFQPSSGSI